MRRSSTEDQPPVAAHYYYYCHSVPTVYSDCSTRDSTNWFSETNWPDSLSRSAVLVPSGRTPWTVSSAGPSRLIPDKICFGPCPRTCCPWRLHLFPAANCHLSGCCSGNSLHWCFYSTGQYCCFVFSWPTLSHWCCCRYRCCLSSWIHWRLRSCSL